MKEGNVVWTFPEGWSAVKYDDWSFYRKQFQRVAGGTRAMDILALSPAGDLWMIEAKDYRRNRRDPGKGPLPMEVARKARDTLAGLLAASANAVGDERDFARVAVRAKRIRVVLHVEQATNRSRLFPTVCDPADVRQKLRQLVRGVDPHPVVMSTETKWHHWTTAWTPPPEDRGQN